MNLKTKVIASEISNLTDARYFAAWGVDYLSYILDESDERFIGFESIKEIKNWVEGPKNLGLLTGLVVPDSIDSIYQELGLDGLVVAPFTETNGISDRYTRVYKEITDLEKATSCSEEFMVVKLPPKTDLAKIKNQLVQIASDNEMFIDGINSVEEIEYLLQEINPSGIVLKGGEEEKVGFKSFDELDEIFEYLEVS